MTIQSEITRIINNIASSYNQVTAKGGTASTGVENLASAIDTIPIGLSPQIIVTAPTGSTVTCDGQSGTEIQVQIENPEYRNLPSGYTQLDYIQSTGTQYIATDYCPNGGTRCYCEFTPTGGSSWQWVFGTRQMNSNSAFSVGFNASYSRQLVLQYESTDTSRISGVYCTQSKNIVASAGVNFILNGTKVYTFANTISSTSPYPFLIFTENSSSGSVYGEYSRIKLHKLQFYEGRTLVRDFVPCKNSSNVLGLYDLVNNVFYDNDGSGTFTAGTEVQQYITGTVWKFEPTVGTHSVVASLSGKTETVSVVVDEVAVFNVNIAYKTYLYNLGDECTSITGGWQRTSTGGTFTKNSDNMQIYYNYYSTGNAGIRIAPINNINLSPYIGHTMYLDAMDNTSTAVGYGNFGLNIDSAQIIRTTGNKSRQLYSGIITPGSTSSVVDLNGEFWRSSSGTLTIYRIWIE